MAFFSFFFVKYSNEKKNIAIAEKYIKAGLYLTSSNMSKAKSTYEEIILSENNIRIWSLILSFIFLILGLLNSKLLEPLNKIWFKFGLILGKLVAPIVMGIIFFFVVTPTGLIMKILRKDLLNLKKNNSTTYWIKKDNSNSNFKNQF